MNVRRLKDDELYHHGIKGQRWGVRRVYTNRLKYTTGNSKGVHRRGDPITTYHELNDNEHSFTSMSNTTIRRNGISFKYDNSMKPGSFTIVGVDTAKGTPMRQIRAKDEASVRELTEVVKKLSGNNQFSSDAVNRNLDNLVQKYGTLEYDVSKYNKEYPYSMFTNISEEDIKECGNHDIDDSVARKIGYTNLARASEAKSKKRIAEGKKLVNKLKLFGESFKEVHSENVSSGINFVKNLFNKEKHNGSTTNKR